MVILFPVSLQVSACASDLAKSEVGQSIRCEYLLLSIVHVLSSLVGMDRCPADASCTREEFDLGQGGQRNIQTRYSICGLVGNYQINPSMSSSLVCVLPVFFTQFALVAV